MRKGLIFYKTFSKAIESKSSWLKLHIREQFLRQLQTKTQAHMSMHYHTNRHARDPKHTHKTHVPVQQRYT